MRLNHEAAKRIAEQRGLTLTAALASAGVSRTAYYSLCRRNDILPRTVLDLAATLGVEPEDLLQKTPTSTTYERRLEQARDICARHPGIDFHNVWHTLTLLAEPPIERLRRSLRRGRA